MEQHVWACDVGRASNFGWFAPWFGADLPEAERLARSGRIASHNWLGLAVPVEDHPTQTIATRGTPKSGKAVIICENRNVLVSDEMAEALAAFDLGAGGLVRSRVVKRNRDRSTRDLGFDLHYWHFGNVKTTLRPDLSRQVKPLVSPATGITRAAGLWQAPQFDALAPDDLSLGLDCLKGPDVWIERGLNVDLFLSDRLAQALRRQRLDTRLHLLRCRVVE